jgi:ribosomal protein L7/L12
MVLLLILAALVVLGLLALSGAILASRRGRSGSPPGPVDDAFADFVERSRSKDAPRPEPRGVPSRDSPRTTPDPGRGRPPRTPTSTPAEGTAPGPVDLRALLLQKLASGERIAAIKLFRAHTGRGLKESKEAVEHLERYGHLPDPPLPVPASDGEVAARATVAATPADAAEPAVPLEQVRALLRDGQKIGAIRLVREHTDWSLREAKEYVEEVAAAEPR